MLDKEKVEAEDDEEMDETYSNLDDDELLVLALRDDDEPASKKKKSTPDKTQGTRKRKTRTFSRSNVLYLGHIPNGFFEHEIKTFLTQFGKVLQVRVSRSPKTGKSRGYAFIQLLHKEVAEIVQKTMHGYILMGRSLVCQHVPDEHVHEKMFLGGLTGKNSVVNTFADARRDRVLAHSQRSTTKEGEAKRVNRLLKADRIRKEKLAKRGIKYNFVGYENQ